MASEHCVKIKGYAPLPQSMSNTDTENDDDDDIDSRRYSPKKKNNIQNEETTTTTVIQENGRFYPLDETKNISNRLRNSRNNMNNLSLGYCNDDIPIMVVDQEDDLWKSSHMSFIRQFFLVASIILCFATISIFLYVLPCNDEIEPPAIKNRPELLWDNTLRGIELLGPISVVPGPPYNLIFMFRGQLYGDVGIEAQGPRVPSRGGGIISMNGGNGSLLWWVILENSPTEINCDIKNIGKFERSSCVVAGENGLLVSIDQITGIIQWNSKANTHSKLPIFFADIDGDGIDDLLTVVISSGDILGPALISGKNGQLLGRHLRPDCRYIRIYSFDVNATISYLCIDSEGRQSLKTIALTDIYEGMNLQRVKKRLYLKLKGSSNPFIIPDVNADEEILSLTEFHHLSIKRRGFCPGDQCQTSMNVTFERKGFSNEPHTIWSSYGSNSYGMEPVSLTEAAKPLVTGFVIKFWQWNDNNYSPESNQQDKINSSIIRRTVTEWISVVIINQTEVHAVNASQTDIMQICKESECQPSSKLQRQSLLVADLNHDRFRELISYQTSYELEREVLVLRSRVQVVRIDIEVAKLTQIVIV